MLKIFQVRISEGVQNLPKTISELPGKAVQFAKDLPSDALNYALNNKVNTAFIASQVYAGVEAKKELEQQKEEAERVLGCARETHSRRSCFCSRCVA
jgi:predicted alternative tryptophan synthase beta-subunit